MTDAPTKALAPDFAEAVERYGRAIRDWPNARSAGDVVRAAQEEDAARSSLLAQYEAMRVENERLRRTIAGCQWYWPEEDTTEDYCSSSPWEIYHEANAGVVCAISRGGVVETRHYGWLPPASDADSDDDFEVDEATEAEAQAKIDAELARRTTLNQAPETGR